MARIKICGVYIIRQLSTNKIYIGSSNDVHKRLLEHKRDLANQIHDNVHLQRAWNVNVSNDFVFELLEVSDLTNYRKREQYYLDTTGCCHRDTGFNMQAYVEKGRLGMKTSEETKAKLSVLNSGPNHPNWGRKLPRESVEKQRKAVTGVPKSNSGRRRMIRLLSPDGNVMEFDGIRRFCRLYNLSCGNVCGVLSGRLDQTKGWRLPPNNL